MARIGSTVVILGSADGDKDHLAMADRLLRIAAEAEQPFADTGGNNAVEPRLKQWQMIAVEAGNARLVDIKTHHLVTHMGQASPRHQTDITATHHCYFHRHLTLSSIQGRL